MKQQVYKYAYSAFIALSILLPNLALTSAAKAGDDGPAHWPALPSSLSAQWWQTAISVPPADNPLSDSTGANCAVGNRGSVWFLYGSLNGGSVRRTCTLPEGKFLFFPVLNEIEANTPGVCGQVGSVTLRELRLAAKQAIDSASGVHVTLDGKSITYLVQRVRSTVFDATFPADNIFNAPCAPGGVPGGVYSPGVDDGLYVFLPPLKAGSHTLSFRGHLSNPGPSAQDITYKLLIKPVKLD